MLLHFFVIFTCEVFLKAVCLELFRPSAHCVLDELNTSGCKGLNWEVLLKMKCRQHVLQCGKEWWGIVRQMAEVNLLSGLKNQVHRAGEVEAAQRAAFRCDKTSAVMISAAVAESIKPLLPPLTCKKRWCKAYSVQPGGQTTNEGRTCVQTGSFNNCNEYRHLPSIMQALLSDGGEK